MGQCGAGCRKIVKSRAMQAIENGDFTLARHLLWRALSRDRDSHRLRRNPFVIENFGKNPCANYVWENTCLGLGSYGTVCRGIDRKSKAVRAIKIIAKHSNLDMGQLQEEIDFLAAMDHPNIIKLYETFEESHQICLVMEVCEGGELYDFMLKQGPFAEHTVAVMMRQVFRAVFYMYSNGVVHRDLKPENFLLDNKCAPSEILLKLIDFGLACCWVKGDEPMTAMTGTLEYMAPEVLAQRYGNEVDVWSCGIIMYNLVCGTYPFLGDDDAGTIHEIMRGRPIFEEPEWAHISITTKDLA